jgi:hypothetical protein
MIFKISPSDYTDLQDLSESFDPYFKLWQQFVMYDIDSNDWTYSNKTFPSNLFSGIHEAGILANREEALSLLAKYRCDNHEVRKLKKPDCSKDGTLSAKSDREI